MKNINVTEQQVKAYKNLINRGATHENLVELVDDETLDEIRRIVQEEIEQSVDVEQFQTEECEQDEGFNMEM